MILHKLLYKNLEGELLSGRDLVRTVVVILAEIYYLEDLLRITLNIQCEQRGPFFFPYKSQKSVEIKLQFISLLIKQADHCLACIFYPIFKKYKNNHINKIH